MSGPPRPARTRATRSAHFDALHAADPDPWNAAHAPAERAKRAAILHALGPGRRALGLELGCGAGVQTQALAPRFSRLDAVDASGEALARARARLCGARSVALHQDALPARPPRRGVQAVLAAEVLYYLDRDALARQIARLRPALAPGAVLVTAHAVRRHRDFAQAPRDVEHALARAFGAPTGERTGRGWRVLRFRAP